MFENNIYDTNLFTVKMWGTYKPHTIWQCQHSNFCSEWSLSQIILDLDFHPIFS